MPDSHRMLLAFALGMLLALLLAGCGSPSARSGRQAQGVSGADGTSARVVSTQRRPPSEVVVIGAVFSPDDRRLLVRYECRPYPAPPGYRPLRLWDTETGQQLAALKGPEVSCMAYLPGGELVLSGSKVKPMQVWKAATGTIVRTFSKGSEGVSCLAVSRDGKLALSGGAALAGVQLWDVESGKPGRTLDKIHDPEAVRLSPDGEWAFVKCDFAAMYRVSSGQRINYFDQAERWKFPLAISADNQFAVSDRPDDKHGEKARLVLWEIATGVDIRTFAPREADRGADNQGHALAAAFSPDGKNVVSLDDDATLRHWSVATGRLERSDRVEDWLRTGAVTADARLAVTVCGEDVEGRPRIRLDLWDATSGGLLRVLEESRAR